MRLFILCMLLSAPLYCQVAYTTKSGKLIEKQWWDKAETQPKLWREYYEVKSFDAGDKLLSTEQINNGVYAEWYKTGTQKRQLRSLTAVPEWYFKLIEFYRDGVIETRDTFYSSGAPESRSEFDKGRITFRETFWPGQKDTGNVKTRENYDKDGKVVSRNEWREDGLPVLLEESDGRVITSRTTFEYHSDSTLKARRKETFSYEWDQASGQRKAIGSTVTLLERTEKGLTKESIDGKKRSEGTVLPADAKTKKRERKHGEWKYWDETGKLVRVETYADGELRETKEFK